MSSAVMVKRMLCVDAGGGMRDFNAPLDLHLSITTYRVITRVILSSVIVVGVACGRDCLRQHVQR